MADEVMRVLFVTPYVPSPVRVRPYHLIRQLSGRCTVSVLTAVPSGEERDLARLRPYCERLEAVPLRRDQIARSCALAALRGESLQAAYCRSTTLSARLASLLERDQFDLIHVEHLRAAHLLFEVPHDVPVVYDAVDCITLLLSRTLRRSHSWKQRLLAALELSRTRAFERRILRHTGQMVVTSDEDAAALRALEPRAIITTIPNGVDLSYFRPLDEPPEPSTIVLSGKMSYHANITAALYFAREILPRVRARHPFVRLRIVGSEPPRAIRALTRDPLVEVTGHVADIRPLVGRATVAVCPVTVKVGIQNKILESMALGVPVVSTAAGAAGLSAVVGEDLLVGQDAREVSDGICRLLEDADMRARVGAAGRRYVEEHHRWQDAADQLERVYRTACLARTEAAR